MSRLNSRLRTKTLNAAAKVMLIAFVLVIHSMMSAQGYFATLSGALTDPSGAMIPGAKMTLLDQEKGYQFHATSDSSGRYLFRSIAPGLYTFSAEMQGFEKIVHTGIRVEVNDNATANLTLKIAGSTQTVQIEAQAPTLNTQDATTGQVINRKFI